jgi:bacterioferritin-associated ferredoxin
VIVCSCHAVSDRAVRAALAAGASPGEVLALTRAGSDCGRCRAQVQALLSEQDEGGCCGGPCETCPRRGAA